MLQPTLAGTMLRTAALQMARSTRSGRSEAAQIALLVAQIASLSLSVSQLREAQGRPVQAAAARRAAGQVADSADQWVGEVRGLVAEQGRRRDAAARPATSTSTSAAARAAAGNVGSAALTVHRLSSSRL